MPDIMHVSTCRPLMLKTVEANVDVVNIFNHREFLMKCNVETKSDYMTTYMDQTTESNKAINDIFLSCLRDPCALWRKCKFDGFSDQYGDRNEEVLECPKWGPVV